VSKIPKESRSHDHMAGDWGIISASRKPKVTNELRREGYLAGSGRLLTKLKASSIGCSG
jgi:hypothetical protein